MDRNPKTYKNQSVIYILATVVLMLLTKIYVLIGDTAQKSSVYMWLQRIISGWDENVFFAMRITGYCNYCDIYFK